MRMCLALTSERGVEEVLRPCSTCGVNWSFLLDMNGPRLRPLRAGSSGAGGSEIVAGPDGSPMLAKYFLLQAGMVDVSLRGEPGLRLAGWLAGRPATPGPDLLTCLYWRIWLPEGFCACCAPCPSSCLPAGGCYQLDRRLNQEVYGPGVSPEDVLAGRVPAPPEFQPLYSLLMARMHDSRAGVHPTHSTSRLSAAGRSPSTVWRSGLGGVTGGVGSPQHPLGGSSSVLGEPLTTPTSRVREGSEEGGAAESSAATTGQGQQQRQHTPSSSTMASRPAKSYTFC